MNPTKDLLRTLIRRYLWLPSLIAAMMLLAFCSDPDHNRRGSLVNTYLEDSPVPIKPPQEARKRHYVYAWSVDEGSVYVRVDSPDPPPAYVTLTWDMPPGVTGANISHQDYATEGSGRITWKLPVDPKTGKTEDVHIMYKPPPGILVDSFQAASDLYGSGASSVSNTDIVIPRGQGTVGSGLAGEVSASQEDYYRWLVHRHFYASGDPDMSPDLCTSWREGVQSEHTFWALRFPVLPPPLAYTESYTLPVLTDPGTSELVLAQDPGWPLLPTPVLSLPLEYRPQYHTFLERELPAAPGQHWLALGAVITPALDCSSVPTVSQWATVLELVLDLGGHLCDGCVLPLYYCYEGQEPPLSLAGLQSWMAGETTSYQGSGITCLGSQPLHLVFQAPGAFSIGRMNTGWVTPTQTISFSHYLSNDLTAGVPVTLALTYSSTPALSWGVYSGTQEGPDLPLVPITGPIRLEAGWPESVRYFWTMAQVPAGTESGAGSLVITATDVISPARVDSVTDLLWVGDWVAPPPALPGYRVYLPLVVRAR